MRKKFNIHGKGRPHYTHYHSLNKVDKDFNLFVLNKKIKRPKS